MFFIGSLEFLIGAFIVLVGFMIFCFAKAASKTKEWKALQEAENKFKTMAAGKYYDDIVAILMKPQEEHEKICPDTGAKRKVAKWIGGEYYWEKYRYTIVVVFDEDGKFNSVEMFA